jgi:large subunit ribosomal protein L4
MKLKVLQKDGKETGRAVALDATVFGIEPNDHTIWLDVRRIQAGGRQGTHKAKERAEVAGSTRKLFRQKGTGGARAGSAKSPLRRSGGTIFGPRPRDYSFKVNKKTTQLARRSALSYKASADAIRIVEDFKFESPDTGAMVAMLAALGLSGSKVLLLTNGVDLNVYRSGRNIPKLQVLNADAVSTLDVLNAKIVVLQEGAIESLGRVLGAVEAPSVLAVKRKETSKKATKASSESAA